MTPPIDLTIYPKKNQIQLAKSNPKIQRAMVEANSIDELVSIIKAKVIICEEAIQYFIDKFNQN